MIQKDGRRNEGSFHDLTHLPFSRPKVDDMVVVDVLLYVSGERTGRTRARHEVTPILNSDMCVGWVHVCHFHDFVLGAEEPLGVSPWSPMR